MIAQNEVNVHGELENKTDNHTVLYKSRTGRTKELKIKLFCFFSYTCHNLNFHNCGKQVFKYFGCTKIGKDSK